MADFSSSIWTDDCTGVDCKGECAYSTIACLCCSPCVVSRAFEELHPQFKRGEISGFDSPWCVLCPRTCLGCGLLFGGEWAISYVVNHAKKKVSCFDSLKIALCGHLLCYPAAISIELRRLYAERSTEKLKANLLG